jgi:hypothetical protein
MLAPTNSQSIKILENRLWEIGHQIADLRSQQQTIIRLLKEMTSDVYGSAIDKQMWVKMLQAAGMDEAAMMKWHAEFEFRSPEAHHDFLLSLGIQKIEVENIRSRSRRFINKRR